VPSALYLFLKTHLQPIGFISDGRVVRVHVSFAIKALYSSFMAVNQLGCWIASLTAFGMTGVVAVATKSFDLKNPALTLVIIVWSLTIGCIWYAKLIGEERGVVYLESWTLDDETEVLVHSLGKLDGITVKGLECKTVWVETVFEKGKGLYFKE